MEKEVEDKFKELLEAWKTDKKDGLINEDQFNKLTTNLSESFKVSVGDPLAELTAELKLQNEHNKLVKAETDLILPKNAYKVFLNDQQKKYDETEQRKLGFGYMVKDLYNQFLNRTNEGIETRLAQYREIQKNALQNEGTPSAGGYLVPTPTLDLVMQDLRESGLFFSETTMYNLGGKDANVPTLTTHAAPTYTAEGTAKAVSNLVFGTAPLVLKKYACLIPLTDELIEDSIIDIEAMIRNLAKDYFGALTDNILFQGDANINGLDDYTTTFITTSGQSFATLTVDNLIQAIGAVRSVDLKNAKWYMTTNEWSAIHTKKGSTNDHYLLPLADMNNKTLLGFPVVFTDSLPIAANGAGDATKKFIVFGNLKKALVGVKNGMTINMTTSSVASFLDGATQRSAFQDNLTVVRLEKRFGLTIPFPLNIVQIKSAT